MTFPLSATPLWVGLGKGPDELVALGAALDHLVTGDGREVSLEQISRAGFRVQELSAVPIEPTREIASLIDGPISWRRLSGQWPDLGDAFMVSAGFARRELVVPRAVVLDLVSRLRALRAEILAGTRQGRIDDMPVPPPPPLSPELEEYEELCRTSAAEAEAFREELRIQRG
ncbi:MAG: hypothetical protein ABI704_23705 [Kofleriaceae bacterium]